MNEKEYMMQEAAKLAPPAGVSGLVLAGVSLQDWVLIMTLVWISVQLAYFLYKRYKEYLDVRN